MTEQSTTRASAQSNVLSTIGCRLHLLLSFVTTELRQDSWRTGKTSREWCDNLWHLQLSSAPLLENSNDAFTTQQVVGFRRILAEAINGLQKGENHRIAQFNAIDKLREAQCSLIEFLTALNGQVVAPEYGTVAPSERATEWEFERGMKEFADAIDAKEPIPICMASRVQFLKCYYMAVLQPKLWNAERHARIVALHEKAISIVTYGMELDSLTRRLDKLKKYSPSEFTNLSGKQFERPLVWAKLMLWRKSE